MLVYLIAVHFSGLLQGIRRQDIVGKRLDYEDLYQKAKKSRSRRKSSVIDRNSVQGRAIISEVVHLFMFSVYERCRSVNIIIKLTIISPHAVLGILIGLKVLKAEVFYELPCLLFVELAFYAFYLDYIPAIVRCINIRANIHRSQAILYQTIKAVQAINKHLHMPTRVRFTMTAAKSSWIVRICKTRSKRIHSRMKDWMSMNPY